MVPTPVVTPAESSSLKSWTSHHTQHPALFQPRPRTQYRHHPHPFLARAHQRNLSTQRLTCCTVSRPSYATTACTPSDTMSAIAGSLFLQDSREAHHRHSTCLRWPVRMAANASNARCTVLCAIPSNSKCDLGEVGCAAATTRSPNVGLTKSSRRAAARSCSSMSVLRLRRYRHFTCHVRRGARRRP